MNPPKPRIQYAIYKKLGRRFDYWDGPFRSYKQALKVYHGAYWNTPTAPQDFYLFKEVLTVVRPKAKKAKSK